MNKLQKLTTRIENDNPDIIGITEVLPKNFRYSVGLSEIQIDEFDCFTNILSDLNEVRGIVMYVNKRLRAQQMTIPKTKRLQSQCGVRYH